MVTAKKHAPKSKKRTVSAEHKAAMAEGRKAAAAVGAYIDALGKTRPQRRRRFTPDQIEAELAAARRQVTEGTGTRKLAAAQHVIDLERRLVEATAPGPDLDALEESFVQWAPVYAASKGISYAAFRASGVPAAVLKRAGIGR